MGFLIPGKLNPLLFPVLLDSGVVVAGNEDLVDPLAPLLAVGRDAVQNPPVDPPDKSLKLEVLNGSLTQHRITLTRGVLLGLQKAFQPLEQLGEFGLGELSPLLQFLLIRFVGAEEHDFVQLKLHILNHAQHLVNLQALEGVAGVGIG